MAQKSLIEMRKKVLKSIKEENDDTEILDEKTSGDKVLDKIVDRLANDKDDSKDDKETPDDDNSDDDESDDNDDEKDAGMPGNKDKVSVKESDTENLLANISEGIDSTEMINSMLMDRIYSKLEELKVEVGAGISEAGYAPFTGGSSTTSKPMTSKDVYDIQKQRKSSTKKTDKKQTKESIDEAVSRKDFKLAADTISKIEDPKKRQEAANMHAEIYAKLNPRFNHALFHKAANTVYGG